MADMAILCGLSHSVEYHKGKKSHTIEDVEDIETLKLLSVEI